MRNREERERLAPVYDWYGPDCGCPEDERKDDGSCRKHPRARDKQRIPSGDWDIWLIRSGRGFGKTRTGAEWLRYMAEFGPKKGQYALVGAVASDVRDVMIQGVSGILRISPPWFMPVYEPSKRSLTWPNGSRALCYSSEAPRDFRGPAFHGAWCDEFAKWSNLEEAWDNLQFGMRQIDELDPDWNPQTCITTTPLPLKLIKELIADPMTKVVDGSTYENAANLAKKFINRIRQKFEGTRFGRQEIYGHILNDSPGALWSADDIDNQRFERVDLPDLNRVVVSVDPSVADPTIDWEKSTAECGITVGGSGYIEHATLGYVRAGFLLADRSIRDHPRVWAQRAVNAYHEFGADCIVAEVNNGGELVKTVIQSVDANIEVKKLNASRGKIPRAEPIANLFAQRRIFHVIDETKSDQFYKLEDQLCSYQLGDKKSPDRYDSYVWLFTELLLEGHDLEIVNSPLPKLRNG